ncbi:PP2C family protein-serine/threonine phosphatase [Streptomyces sp. INA 01156]
MPLPPSPPSSEASARPRTTNPTWPERCADWSGRWTGTCGAGPRRAACAAVGAAADGHQVAEEFVTVLLLEILPDGQVRALNCGHPWPHLLSGTRAEPLARADPHPPLGPFPLPAELPTVPCGRLLPGDILVLHTDGAEDARDAEGRFFPLPEVLAAAARETPRTPQAVLRTVLTALTRHTGGSPRTTSPSWSSGTSARLRAPPRPRHNPRGRSRRTRVRRALSSSPHSRASPQRTRTAGGAVRPAAECRAGSWADGADTGRRTVRGEPAAGRPLRGTSVNRPETLRDSAHTLRIRALRSHPV